MSSDQPTPDQTDPDGSEDPGPDLDPQTSVSQPDPLDGVVDDATEGRKMRSPKP